MKNKLLKLILILSAVFVVLFTFAYLKYFHSPIPRSISKFELSLHNSQLSCYVAINTDVYDITEFVSKHSGGNEIIQTCGHDVDDAELSYLFYDRFTPIKIDRERVIELIRSYYIGKLVK